MTLNLALPDGLSKKQYPAYLRWTWQQWAWEFLRRNSAFQRGCELVNPSQRGAIRTSMQVARNYGLREFKHYLEDYASGQGPAVFAGLPVYNNLDGEKSKSLTLTLRPEEAAFRIDLSSHRKSVIDEQLAHVKQRIHQLLDQHAKPPRSTPRPQQHSSEKLLTYLRILDAVSTKATKLPDAAMQIFPDTEIGHLKHELDTAKDPAAKTAVRVELANHLRSAQRTARPIAEKGYLVFAQWSGRPDKS
ncbi:transcriptional regulator domain-containing protein [Achromobacter insolitus]|uniref:transcriptional regulator domain-containing protein n=1 Tax=Achromobacter insolitus TaxID=217204 RepID=UPI001EEF24CD|nr:hypothetical protein [Achromobacter insolitus]